MPASRAIFGPDVPNDLQEVVEYLAERSPSAAIRFSEVFQRTVEEILKFPGAGSPKVFDETGLDGIRSWRVRGFRKYLIFYRQIEGGISIIGVLHGARDVPEILRRRV